MALSRTLQTAATGSGASKTTGSFTPPNNSLLVMVAMAQPDNDVVDQTGATIADTASLSWTKRVSINNVGSTVGYLPDLIIWTAPVTTGVSMTVTVTKAAGSPDLMKWFLQPISYTGYDTGSPTGVTGSAQNGPADGSYNPSLSGSPASTSEVIAFIAGTCAGSGDTKPVTGTGWTQIAISNDAGYYGLHIQIRVGSTTGSVLWDDVLGPASTDTYWDTHTAYLALEIKDGGGGGRTTKNTRAFPLGMEIGMNWVSNI